MSQYNEVTQWGLRATKDTAYCRKGAVLMSHSADEADVRWWLGPKGGWSPDEFEVVSRTVVTFTTEWRPA